MCEMSRLHPGLPREEVSCPGCGSEYGAYGRKVCMECQECSKCCSCTQNYQRLVEAAVFIADL